jgi:hypothetical protein
MSLRIIFLFTLLTAFLFSCKKELTRPSWETDLSFPVIKTEMGLENLIADSLLSADDTGFVSLVFNASVFKLDLDTLLNLPDTTVSDTFTIPPPLPSVNVNPGQVFISNTENKRFDLDEIELSEVKISTGQTNFYISSTVSQPTLYEYTITNALKNGNPFHIIIQVPAGSQSNPAIVSGSFDFDGYELDLRGISGAEYNKYQTVIKVSLDPAASPTTVSSSDKVIVKNTFANLKPSYAKGYFGSQQIEIPYEETVFDFLENLSGTLDLDQATIELTIENGIGIDATVKFDTIQSVNNQSGNTVVLNHSFIGNSININRALDYAGAVTASVYPILLNNSNSNTDFFLENLPNRIGIKAEILVNPFGNISGHQDFLYSDKTFDVRVNAEIPLHIIAENLTLTDTLAIQFDNEESQNVNHGVVHIFAENGFPLNANVQLYLLNANGIIIDSIADPAEILSAYTNSSNIVTLKRNSRIDITLNAAQLDHLMETERILLKTVFNTSSLTQHVPIFDSYRIGIKISTELNYTIE